MEYFIAHLIIFYSKFHYLEFLEIVIRDLKARNIIDIIPLFYELRNFRKKSPRNWLC